MLQTILESDFQELIDKRQKDLAEYEESLIFKINQGWGDFETRQLKVDFIEDPIRNMMLRQIIELKACSPVSFLLAPGCLATV